MSSITVRTMRTLVIENVTDELFWYMARYNMYAFEYYGDDAYITHLRPKTGFKDVLPDRYQAEYNAIVRYIKRSKSHRLEIHPTTLSDRWDKVERTDSPEEFLEQLKSYHWNLTHYTQP